jgi:hypothetical protein
MERVQMMLEEGKQLLKEQRDKGKAMRPPGLFKRLYDVVRGIRTPGNLTRSSGAQIDIRPPPQEHTGKQ